MRFLRRNSKHHFREFGRFQGGSCGQGIDCGDEQLPLPSLRRRTSRRSVRKRICAARQQSALPLRKGREGRAWHGRSLRLFPAPRLRQPAAPVKARLREWAHANSIPIDESGYTLTLRDNLFIDLSPAARAEFAQGDGGELGTPGKRGKMQALHSSSALACNVFEHWRDRNASALVWCAPSAGLHRQHRLRAQVPDGSPRQRPEPGCGARPVGQVDRGDRVQVPGAIRATASCRLQGEVLRERPRALGETRLLALPGARRAAGWRRYRVPVAARRATPQAHPRPGELGSAVGVALSLV